MFSSSTSSDCCFLLRFRFVRNAIESSSSSVNTLSFLLLLSFFLVLFLLSFLSGFFSPFLSFCLLFSLPHLSLSLPLVAILPMSVLSSEPSAVLFGCWVGEPDVDSQSLATCLFGFIAYMSIDFDSLTSLLLPANSWPWFCKISIYKWNFYNCENVKVYSQ